MVDSRLEVCVLDYDIDVGRGNADKDTSAFLKAIEDAGKGKTERRYVRVPRGEYLINQNLFLNEVCVVGSDSPVWGSEPSLMATIKLLTPDSGPAGAFEQKGTV